MTLKYISYNGIMCISGISRIKENIIDFLSCFDYDDNLIALIPKKSVIDVIDWTIVEE